MTAFRSENCDFFPSICLSLFVRYPSIAYVSCLVVLEISAWKPSAIGMHILFESEWPEVVHDVPRSSITHGNSRLELDIYTTAKRHSSCSGRISESMRNLLNYKPLYIIVHLACGRQCHLTG